MREDESRLVLVDEEGVESEVDKEEIEERRAIWVSPMPADFGMALEDDTFVNLLSFLLSPPDKIDLITEGLQFETLR